MTPAEIPRPQSQRVALYEQRFGKFDSGKNAYWSLRKERPVSLAEGARFDVQMRAGALAPVAPRASMMLNRPPPMMIRTMGPDNMPWNRPPIAPQEITSVMPTEARYVAALPAAPPPGPAQPPKEPLFEAIMRQLREKQAGPATETITMRPSFAAPARPLAAAAPAPVMAGFDMKKLALPLALVAGAFVVSKLV